MKKEIIKIVKYWDQKGLSSNESSTSNQDINISKCINYIESELLKTIIMRDVKKKLLAIDIGAGNGRLTKVILEYFLKVIAIEPAKNLFNELKINCINKNLELHNVTFEEMKSNKIFNLVILSGVLYLYDDKMINNLMKKLKNNTDDESVILIRDFIVKKGIEKKSSVYIDGWFCFYRDKKYWKDVADYFGFKEIEIFQSKPIFNLYALFSSLKFTKFYSSNIIKNYYLHTITRKRNREIIEYDNGLQTVFIIMKN